MTLPPSDEQPNPFNTRKPDEAPRKKIEPRIALKKGSKAEDVFSFAKENTKDTIAYIFLIVGFLLLFFEPLYGGTVLGVLMGLYFTAELAGFWRNANDWVEEWGMVKTLVLAGILLSFFISGVGPAVIIVVTAMTVILKQLFMPDVSASLDKPADKDPTL